MKKRKIFLVFRLKVVESNVTEIREKNIARDFFMPTSVQEVADICEGLALSRSQTVPCGFVLHEQLAGPKKINEASCPGETVNWLLKSRDSTSGYEIGRASCRERV